MTDDIATGLGHERTDDQAVGAQHFDEVCFERAVQYFAIELGNRLLVMMH